MNEDLEMFKWLTRHGYLKKINGELYISSKGVLLLGNLTGDAANEVTNADASSGTVTFSPDTWRAMRRGVNTLQARYGTDDMWLILYNEALKAENGREAVA